MLPLARKGEEAAGKCGRWQRFRANGRISRLTYAGVEERASCLRQDALGDGRWASDLLLDPGVHAVSTKPQVEGLHNLKLSLFVPNG